MIIWASLSQPGTCVWSWSTGLENKKAHPDTRLLNPGNGQLTIQEMPSVGRPQMDEARRIRS